MTQPWDDNVRRISRRVFVVAGSGAATALAFNLRNGIEIVQAKPRTTKEVKIVRFSSSGQREDTVSMPMVLRRTRNGSSSYHHLRMRSRAGMAPKRLTPASTGISTTRVCITAFAATLRFSALILSSTRARDGRAFGKRSPKKTFVKALICLWGWNAPRFRAGGATLILATSSMMAPDRQACATA